MAVGTGSAGQMGSLEAEVVGQPRGIMAGAVDKNRQILGTNLDLWPLGGLKVSTIAAP